MRMKMRDQTEIQILQTHHTRNQVVLPPLVCSFACLVTFGFRKMELNRSSALILIAIYIGYVAFSIHEFIHDE